MSVWYQRLPMKLICQWHCLAYHSWALWELINACKSPWELQRKDALCMQSPAAFPWCLLHTCAHCIMCRLSLVAECLLCTYGLSMIDGWIRVPTGSSPLSAGSLPTHVRAPSASFLRHSCQVSQNNDYLAPETNLHPDTFPSCCLITRGLLCRGQFPTSQGSCETSFLHVCKICQEDDIKVWEGESSSCSFLLSLLANNYSHACKTSNLYHRCPYIPPGKDNRVRLLHLQSGQL